MTTKFPSFMAHCCWCNLTGPGCRDSTNERPVLPQYWPIRDRGCLPHLAWARDQQSSVQSSSWERETSQSFKIFQFLNIRKYEFRYNHPSNVTSEKTLLSRERSQYFLREMFCSMEEDWRVWLFSIAVAWSLCIITPGSQTLHITQCQPLSTALNIHCLLETYFCSTSTIIEYQ